MDIGLSLDLDLAISEMGVTWAICWEINLLPYIYSTVQITKRLAEILKNFAGLS